MRAASLVLLPDLVTPSNTQEQRVQREILQSMTRHQWWAMRGVPVPDPVPTTFYEVEQGRVLPVISYAQPLYYGLGALVLRLTDSTLVEAAYWRLRVLAIALSLVTLVLGWAGTRLLFGPAVAAGATAVGAVHPQFLLIAITANPDALVNVFGAFIWWQAACVVRGRHRHMSLLLLLVAAGGAVLTKRSAMPIAAAAVVVAASLFVVQTWRMSRREILLAGIVVIAGVTILIGTLLVFEDQWTRLLVIWKSAFVVRRPADRATVSAGVEYVRTSIDFAWLVAGWLRFRAPEPWLWVARSLTLIGIAGAAVLTVRSRTLRWPLLMAWLFVAFQLGTVISRGFWSLAAPEARHSFVVFAPATVLLWMGLTDGVPAPVRRYSVALVLATLALLDVTGFTAVLIPAYVPSILSVP